MTASEPCPSWCEYDHRDGEGAHFTRISHRKFGDRRIVEVWAGTDRDGNLVFGIDASDGHGEIGLLLTQPQYLGVVSTLMNPLQDMGIVGALPDIEEIYRYIADRRVRGFAQAV